MMESKIRTVLTEYGQLSGDVAGFSAEDNLYARGLTSHNSVNVMLALEDAFDVEFPEALLRKETFASISSISEALSSLDAAVN